MLLAAAMVPVGAASRPSPPVLRQDLRQILAQPAYQQAGKDWWWELKLRLLRAVAQWWQDHVTPYLEGLYTARPVLYWVTLTVIVLLLLAVLYHLYLTLRSAFDPGRRQRSSGPAPPEARDTRGPEAMLREADAAAAGGDYPLAYRWLYLALIRHLDRRALLRYDAASTNYDYLRQLRNEPGLTALVSPLTRAVEPVWYGYRTASAADYARCREWVQAAWEEGGAHGAL